MAEFESFSDFTDGAADSVNFDEVEMSDFNSDANEFLKEQFSENGVEASDTVGTIKDGSMLGSDGEPIKVKGPSGDVDVPEAITDPEISSDATSEAMAEGLLGDGVDKDIKDNVKSQLKDSIDQNPERVKNIDQAEIKADTDAGEKATTDAGVTEADLNESPTGDDTKNQNAAQKALAKTPVEKINSPAKAQEFIDSLSKELDPLKEQVDGLSDKLDQLKEDVTKDDKVKEAGGVGKFLIAGLAGLFTYSLIKARQNYLNGCWVYKSDGTKCKSMSMTCLNDNKPQGDDSCNPDPGTDPKTCIPAGSSSSKLRRLMRMVRVNSTGKPLGTTAPIKYLDPNCAYNPPTNPGPCVNEGSAVVSSSCSCKSRVCKNVTYSAVTDTTFFGAFQNLIGIPGNLANNFIDEASNIFQTLLKIGKWIAIIAAVVVGIILIVKIIQFFFKKNEPKEGEDEKLKPTTKPDKATNGSKSVAIPQPVPQPAKTVSIPQPIAQPVPQPKSVSIPQPIAQPVQQLPQPMFYQRQVIPQVPQPYQPSQLYQPSQVYQTTYQPFQGPPSGYQFVEEPVGQVTFPQPTVLPTSQIQSRLPLYSSEVPIRQLGDPLGINPQLRFGGKKMRIKKYSIGIKKRR